jgi:hypothetical protein
MCGKAADRHRNPDWHFALPIPAWCAGLLPRDAGGANGPAAKPGAITPFHGTLPLLFATKKPSVDVDRSSRRSPPLALQEQARWLPSGLVPHRHRPRAELQPAHELQVDTLR